MQSLQGAICYMQVMESNSTNVSPAENAASIGNKSAKDGVKVEVSTFAAIQLASCNCMPKQAVLHLSFRNVTFLYAAKK